MGLKLDVTNQKSMTNRKKAQELEQKEKRQVSNFRFKNKIQISR